MTPRTYRATSSSGWLSPSQKFRFGLAVRAALDASPRASVAELVAKTSAPVKLVMRVRARWLSTRSTHSKEEHLRSRAPLPVTAEVGGG